MKTICIFGDSITMGIWDPECGGWVSRLRNFFASNGYEICVYNLGVSGDKTEDLTARFENESRAREPDFIVFAIGVNDSQYINSKDAPRVSLDNFRKNLAVLLNKAEKIASKIAFIGLIKVDESKTMPIPWNAEKYYDNENVSQYNSAIEAFCNKNRVPFLNIVNLLDKTDLEDGLHPNARGHKKMFERIKDFMLKIV